MADVFDAVANLAKRRGFVFPGSDIYGGLSGTWDYGPLGVLLKRNIKDAFWRAVVSERDDVVGLDAAILMHSRVWEASGHVDSFSDPLVECKKCHNRFRADQIGFPVTSHEQQSDVIDLPPCPNCGAHEWTPPRQFNLMVATELGSVEGEKQRAYLRGEITQGVHVNFKNVLDSTRIQLPFGIAQIGKAFRNEITPGQFTFRSREFEQMELQFYIAPHDGEGERWFSYWKEERMRWYQSLGFRPEHLRFREHAADERAHYARGAWDIEYRLPNGEWKEMEGIHHRGDWDIRRHQEFSKKDLTYFDEATKERYIPWVIETSGGVDRAALFALTDAYREEVLDSGDTRVVLGLHPTLAPYKVAVFPLLPNKPALVSFARTVYETVKKRWSVSWDDRGNIGKRYRAQDEIGTPYCITIDFESIEKGDVTVRNRDSMAQERIPIATLEEYIAKKLGV